MKVLEEKGISSEVGNLRWIRPLDVETLVTSVKKSHYVVTVEQGWPQFGMGFELTVVHEGMLLHVCMYLNVRMYVLVCIYV